MLIIGVHGVLHGGTAEPLREARALGTLDSQSSSVFSKLAMKAEVPQEKTKVQKLLSVGTLKSGATWTAKQVLPLIGGTGLWIVNFQFWCTGIIPPVTVPFVSTASCILGYNAVMVVQSCVCNAAYNYLYGSVRQHNKSPVGRSITS